MTIDLRVAMQVVMGIGLVGCSPGSAAANQVGVVTGSSGVLYVGVVVVGGGGTDVTKYEFSPFFLLANNTSDGT